MPPSPAIPSLVTTPIKRKKPCYPSRTAGLHRFLILF
nr:MAG TPA: hypothetical protein [Caudoviricetes sp.]